MELTTSQAVQLYQVYPNVLHRLILMGQLEARKDSNGRWLISRESLESWDSQRVRRASKIQRDAFASKRPPAKQLKFKFDDEPP